MSNNVHPRLYKQPGATFSPSRYIADEVYSEIVDTTVIVCADTIFFSRKDKVVYLTERKSKPMNTWWMIGGRVRIGETGEAAAVRCIFRETNLVVAECLLLPLGMNRYFFNSRQQMPQNIGCDSLCYTFALESDIDQVAWASKHLDSTEYQSGGLQAFSRKQLVKHKVAPALIDLYDKLFA